MFVSSRRTCRLQVSLTVLGYYRTESFRYRPRLSGKIKSQPPHSEPKQRFDHFCLPTTDRRGATLLTHDIPGIPHKWRPLVSRPLVAAVMACGHNGIRDIRSFSKQARVCVFFCVFPLCSVRSFLFFPSTDLEPRQLCSYSSNSLLCEDGPGSLRHMDSRVRKPSRIFLPKSILNPF